MPTRILTVVSFVSTVRVKLLSMIVVVCSPAVVASLNRMYDWWIPESKSAVPEFQPESSTAIDALIEPQFRGTASEPGMMSNLVVWKSWTFWDVRPTSTPPVVMMYPGCRVSSVTGLPSMKAMFRRGFLSGEKAGSVAFHRPNPTPGLHC